MRVDSVGDSTKRYGFIVTKPLQLMIALTIIEQLSEKILKELIIVDAFDNSEKVALNMTEFGKKWGTVTFKKSHDEGYKYASEAGFSKLFIDSDIGFKKYIQLLVLKIRSKKTLIAVYEEGLGSYRKISYAKWKKSILNFIGAGTNFGGCSITKEIYLYDADQYSEKFHTKNISVIEINLRISKLMDRSWEALVSIFDADSMALHVDTSKVDSTCMIYLSNWWFREEDLEKFSSLDELKFLKLHPNIKKIELRNHYGFTPVLSSIPAEILILHASKHFNKVKVYHHGSSVCRYVGFKNVDFFEAS